MDWNFLTDGKDSLTVTTDSRKITRGCVFVALRGEHFDGNQFAQQALEMGAAYALVDEDIPATCSQKREYEGKLIRVENTMAALQDLARAWVRKWRQTPSSFGKSRPVIAITGTNGKTTTKELTAAVLSTRYRIHYTQGNYNNSLGVPLTLLQLNDTHELAVVEMGASHPGDIEELVQIVEPDYGLITNVGYAHLQGFGSFEGVMQTKGELYDYLVAHNGSVFRNADNAYLSQMWEKATAGQSWSGQEYLYHREPMPDGTHLVGEYNAENIAAALCIGERFGIGREEGLQAIRAYIPSNNRSQAMQTAKNRLVVDAYNANYTSMQAALNSFDGDTYILGAMRELGDFSHTAHQNIVNMLLERKAENVYLVGDEWKETTSPYPVFASAEELKEQIEQKAISFVNQHILIKGSRSNRLEQLIDVL